MRTLVLLLAATPALADTPFVVRTTSGKEHAGPVVALDGWDLRHGQGAGRRLAAGEWLSLRRAELPLPEFPTEQHLILANGDRVPAPTLGLTDEKLTFRHPVLDREASLPLSAVALIWRLPPDGVVSAERLRHRLLRAKRAKDIILLRNGDTAEGTVQAIKGGFVDLEVNKKTVQVRWVQVSAVAMSTELLDRLRPKGTHARVILTGSLGRLTLTSAASDGETLTGKTVFGADFRADLDKVAGLEILKDDVVSLSDLKPAKYDYSPYLDERWLWSADATVTGGDLRLGGSTYDRGIGLHANSRATYNLGGKYRAFEARVGLDDKDGRGGSARVRVLVDGKPADLGKADALQGGEPLSVRVDLTGAKELTLEVLPAGRGPVRAVVNWVDARLLR